MVSVKLLGGVYPEDGYNIDIIHMVKPYLACSFSRYDQLLVKYPRPCQACSRSSLAVIDTTIGDELLDKTVWVTAPERLCNHGLLRIAITWY